MSLFKEISCLIYVLLTGPLLKFLLAGIFAHDCSVVSKFTGKQGMADVS